MLFPTRYNLAILFWSIAGILLFSCLTYWLINQSIQFYEVLPFNHQINRFMNYYQVMDRSDNPSGSFQPQGKILPINVMEKEVDSLFFEIPERHRPGSPGEVTLIAFLEWTTRTLGPYLDGDGKPTSRVAEQTVCRITVVDLATRKIVNSKTISGDLPPDRIRSRESSLGTSPVFAVANYLISLVQS